MKKTYYVFDVFLEYHQKLKNWLNTNRTRLNSEGFSNTQIDRAADLYRLLGVETTIEYFSNRKEMFEDKNIRSQFIEEITRLQNSVLVSGKIEAISEIFEMTKKESINQCTRADNAFSRNTDLQKLLSDANYSFFTGKTMATAKDLLKLKLDSFYTGGMPHLTASNGAIGYMTRDFVLQKTIEGETTFTITDIGSGTGATLASIILGLSDLDNKLENKIKVNVNSIEGCHDFYSALESEMIPAIMSKAKGFQNIKLKINTDYGNIKNLIPETKNTGSQIYTANYVFHRLSDNVKKDICSFIGQKSQGNAAAFFLADIYRNISEMPNRRYFNFALNGPLNPGNDLNLMYEIMTQNGFSKIISDNNMTGFRGLPKQIVSACEYAKAKEQGFLIAGYRK